MKFSVALAMLPLAMAGPAQESEAAAPLLRRGNILPGKYIVKLKEDSVRITSSSSALSLLSAEPQYTYNNIMKGFAASLDLATVEKLRQHPEVCETVKPNWWQEQKQKAN